MALYAFVDRLEIGNRGLAARAPIDDVLATVDQTFGPEMNEVLAHGTGKTGVQREPLARPIDTCAFAPDLRLDASAVLFFPLPDAALEFFAAEILAFDAFGGQLALDNHLGRDAGMIRTGKPERNFAAHAMPAYSHVGHGVF